MLSGSEPWEASVNQLRLPFGFGLVVESARQLAIGETVDIDVTECFTLDNFDIVRLFNLSSCRRRRR